jgi:hypothetical protein
MPLQSSEIDILLLDSYIKGLLSENEKLVLESRLLTEDSLKNDYEYLQKVAAATRANVLKEKLNMLQEVEVEIVSNSETDESSDIHYLSDEETKKAINWWKLGIVAVMFGVMAIVGKYYFKKGEVQYPSQYADLFENRFEHELILHKTYRAAEPTDPYTKEQRRAYELYSIKEFDMASPLLEKLWVAHKDTLALFYWGVSEIGRGEVKKGEEVLGRSELLKYQNKFLPKKQK